MSDLISREDAREAIEKLMEIHFDRQVVLAKARDAIVSLPYADRPTGWIPVSERLPKENEYVDDVCKYYLVQDEYGDMHVAHLSKRGWEPMESIKVLGCDVVAWMPLPEPYKGGEE